MLTLTLIVLANPEAAKPAEPEAVAVEMVRAAIETVVAGRLDTFVRDYCDPERCHTALSVANWKAYQLKAMRTNGGYCLHGENDHLDVARWEGSLAEDGKAKVFLSCTNRQLPVPVEIRWDAEAGRPWIRAVSF